MRSHMQWRKLLWNTESKSLSNTRAGSNVNCLPLRKKIVDLDAHLVDASSHLSRANSRIKELELEVLCSFTTFYPQLHFYKYLFFQALLRQGETLRRQEVCINGNTIVLHCILLNNILIFLTFSYLRSRNQRLLNKPTSLRLKFSETSYVIPYRRKRRIFALKFPPCDRRPLPLKPSYVWIWRMHTTNWIKYKRSTPRRLLCWRILVTHWQKTKKFKLLNLSFSR